MTAPLATFNMDLLCAELLMNCRTHGLQRYVFTSFTQSELLLIQDLSCQMKPECKLLSFNWIIGQIRIINTALMISPKPGEIVT